MQRDFPLPLQGPQKPTQPATVYLIFGPQWEGRARTLRRFLPSGSSTTSSSARVWKPDQEVAPSVAWRLGGCLGHFLFCPLGSDGAWGPLGAPPFPLALGAFFSPFGGF